MHDDEFENYCPTGYGIGSLMIGGLFVVGLAALGAGFVAMMVGAIV